jgi:hypothetical protein
VAALSFPSTPAEFGRGGQGCAEQPVESAGGEGKGKEREGSVSPQAGGAGHGMSQARIHSIMIMI